MIGQLNINGIDKVETAIKRLRTFEPSEGYYLCFSGGKDSVVIKALADMAGVKYDAHYNTLFNSVGNKENMKVRIKTRVYIPEYKSDGAAGMDIRALLPRGSCIIFPGQIELIPTGISLELPKGYEAQVRARSGLSTKHGIGIASGVGTIDSDYRGEIGVPLINWGTEPFTVNDGDRIAQLVVARCEKVEFVVVDELTETERGTGGFGSTGR